MRERGSDHQSPQIAVAGGKSLCILLLSTVVSTAALAAPVWAQGYTDTAGSHSALGGEGDHTDGDSHGLGEKGGTDRRHNGTDGDDHGSGEDHSSGQGGGFASSGGARPVWAHEGLPQVDLGGLNVGRSPARVIDRAFDEALSGFTEDVAVFYRLDLDEMEDALSTRWAQVNLIDSPIQNLALFRDALDGTSVLRDMGINTDTDTLLAAFLGTASDKEIPITQATVQAVSILMGHPMNLTEAATLSAKAERIRVAILAGHG